MKRTLLVVFALVLLVSGALYAQGPNRFSTKEACKTALQAEQAEIYTPTYLKAHHEPVSGQEVRPLPDFACVQMMAVGGVTWVAQEKGTPFIFEGEVPVARYDCGNKVYDIEYVPLEPLAPPTSAPPAPPTLVEFPPLEQVRPGLELTLIKPRLCETDNTGWNPLNMLKQMGKEVACNPGRVIMYTGIAYGMAQVPSLGGGHHPKFEPKPPHPHPPKPPLPCTHGCQPPVKIPAPIDRSPL